MKKRIAFIGYGDIAKKIINLLVQTGITPDDFIYFDDIAHKNKVENSYEFNDYLNPNFAEFEFCVCLGYRHLELKYKIIEKLENEKRKLFTFIHATSYVDKLATIERGVIIYAMANIDHSVSIKKGTIVSNSVSVGHDSLIEECCYLSNGTLINGGATVGKCTFLASGTVVANRVRIGENCFVGIGSVVTKNVDNNVIGIGVPFKKKKIILR